LKKIFIAVFIFLISFECVFADLLVEYNPTESNADVCTIGFKMDAGVETGKFKLGETTTITVYTMKACKSPVDADYVIGRITRPTGVVDELNFTHVDTGVYKANYTFTRIGTYRIYIEAYSEFWTQYGGAVWVVHYITVPYLSMYLSLPYGTRYLPGDEVRVWAHVETSEGTPVNDAKVNITVFYPNLTAFISNQSMNLFANGDYYYSFTAPEVEGQYFVQVQATDNYTFQSKSKVFYVGGWASQIEEINQSLHEVVIPYLEDINKTVYDIEGVIQNLNITASNIDYLIYEIVKEINETQGKYNVTVYNDTSVENCSGLRQVIWRYDNESEAGVVWIRYRCCANTSTNFTGTLELTNLKILNYSCFNCSGGDALSVGASSLSYSLVTSAIKGWDLKVKLIEDTGTAKFDGTINGARDANLTYLGDTQVSALPFSFTVATTKLASTVFLSLERMKDELDSIISDLNTIKRQISGISVSSGGGGGGGGSVTNNYYYYNTTNVTTEILESVRKLLEEGNVSVADAEEIITELNKAKSEILKAIEYYHNSRKKEITGLASLFSALETSSTITMLLGLVFVILVVGVFLYIVWSSREEEDLLSKILLLKFLYPKRDATSRLMAFSLLSGERSYLNKLFKFLVAKDILEERDEIEELKGEIKYEVKRDIIRKIKERLKR